MSSGQPKKLLGTLVKLALSAALIGYLAYKAAHDPQFRTLVAGPKNWPLLLSALPVCLAAVTVTILRWQLLISALGLSFSVRETLRAGFLAYLANLLPLGLVAGDSLKMVMLGHRNPRRKTEAVAAVVVDRVLGLYALLLLAAVATLLLPAGQFATLSEADQLFVARLSWVLRAASLGSTVGLVVMLIPAVTQSRLWDRLEQAPVIGPVLHKLVGAMRAYRRRLDLLAAAIGISLVVHVLYVLFVVIVSQGIGIAPKHRPPPGSIFVIVPPTMIAGALPIGFYEISVTILFHAISPPGAPENIGLLIALAYRLIQMSIASIGLGYWLVGRSEVRELMHEAQEQPPAKEIGGEEPSAASA